MITRFIRTESLIEAEPRAQRQIIEHLSPEHARAIFGEMTVLQLANVFTSLPQEKLRDAMAHFASAVRTSALPWLSVSERHQIATLTRVRAAQDGRSRG